MIKPSQAKHGNLIPLPNKSSKGGGGTSQCVGRQSLLWIWGYFPHSLRESRKKQNRPFLSLDDVSSGYDVWNNSCHLLIMRSSGLRTKPVSKNGRAGRWKDSGPSMTSMDHKTDQPTKAYTSGLLFTQENLILLCLKQLTWVFWSWQLKAQPWL